MPTRSLNRTVTLLALLGAAACRRGPRPTAAPNVNLLLDRQEQLAATDSLAQQGYHDRFEVPVGAGDQLKVTVSSSTFDPVLHVTTPTGANLVNDDYRGDRTRSQLEVSSAVAGSLKITVSSFVPGATGAYRVQVQRVATNVPPPVQTTAAAMMPGFVPAGGVPSDYGYNSQFAAVAPTAARTDHQVPPGLAGPLVQLGQDLQGNLGAQAAALPSGETADVYQFQGHAGSPVTFEMDSTAFDTFLVVTGPNGERWQNDDSGGTTNSLLTVQPPEDGVYHVVATSYRAGSAGAYELKVSSGTRGEGAGDGAPQGVPAQGGAAGGVAAQTTAGALAQGDSTLRTGEFADAYTFTWPAGTTVHLEARSTAFDTYLIVRAPSGQQHDNDDGPGGGTNAALDLQTTEAGTYRVTVTSYRPGETGAYQLLVSAPGTGAAQIAQPEQPADGTQPAQGTQPQAVTAGGREIRGALAQGDRQLHTGEFYDTQTLHLRAGAPVHLRLSSTDFDPYLIVRPPSGQQQDNDDFTPGTRDSGIDIPVAESGNYQVLVTSYRAGETGAYVLHVDQNPTAPGAPGATGVPSQPGQPTLPGVQTAGTGPRIWGVFAGITNYPAGINSLPECANDARKMVESLTRRGLLDADHAVLLTDNQVTLAGLRQAMTQMSARVGPDDVFVFFYSGHGGHTEGGSRDPREIDGTDEYIHVYDGDLMDDEMGTLFDGIHARIAMLALDSCFSGGFAKDVITRPGRMGLFSSEEDVTSDVALSFQAGGYLSHFLQTGIEGAADDDPRDSVLTVGELTHYVWLQFGTHAQNVRQSMGYQQLVIDRGAVGDAQVLWTYQGEH